MSPSQEYLLFYSRALRTQPWQARRVRRQYLVDLQTSCTRAGFLEISLLPGYIPLETRSTIQGRRGPFLAKVVEPEDLPSEGPSLQSAALHLGNALPRTSRVPSSAVTLFPPP